MTRPDRPRGRGRAVQPPPVAERARALGLEVIQPEALHDPDVAARIAAAEPDVLCVCAYGVLVREPLLSAYEILNVHPSLLPRWRGAAPIERAIMAGDLVTGVSIMRLTAGLDSGPVCLQEEEPIRPDDDFGTLSARLERRGGALLVRALDERPPYVEQDEALVTYAEKIGPGDRALDPARPPEEVERTVRALRPHIGARVPLPGGNVLGVLAARVDGPAGARGRGARARRRRAAPAVLPRRRARAAGDPPAGRAPDARRGLAARPPGPGAHRLPPPGAHASGRVSRDVRVEFVPLDGTNSTNLPRAGESRRVSTKSRCGRRTRRASRLGARESRRVSTKSRCGGPTRRASLAGRSAVGGRGGGGERHRRRRGLGHRLRGRRRKRGRGGGRLGRGELGPAPERLGSRGGGGLGGGGRCGAGAGCLGARGRAPGPVRGRERASPAPHSVRG